MLKSIKEPLDLPTGSSPAEWAAFFSHIQERCNERGIVNPTIEDTSHYEDIEFSLCYEREETPQEISFREEGERLKQQAKIDREKRVKEEKRLSLQNKINHYQAEIDKLNKQK